MPAQIIRVLRHAWNVRRCKRHRQWSHPTLSKRCKRCEKVHTFLSVKHHRWVTTMQEREFISWYPICGWFLTDLGVSFFRQLKGDYDP